LSDRQPDTVIVATPDSDGVAHPHSIRVPVRDFEPDGHRNSNLVASRDFEPAADGITCWGLLRQLRDLLQLQRGFATLAQRCADL
jgi:hypothetical protein